MASKVIQGSKMRLLTIVGTAAVGVAVLGALALLQGTGDGEQASAKVPVYSFSGGGTFSDSKLYTTRSLDDLVDKSDVVIKGTVTKVEAIPIPWEEPGDEKYEPEYEVENTIRVDESYFGEVESGATLVVRKDDGWAGGRLSAGQSGWFFLADPEGNGIYAPITGGAVVMDSPEGLVINDDYPFLRRFDNRTGDVFDEAVSKVAEKVTREVTQKT